MSTGIQYGNGNVQTNVFSDIVSVEVREPYGVIDDDRKFKEFDGMSLETVEYEPSTQEKVELTLRIPEQFFTREYYKSDYEEALADNDIGGLTDWWRSDTDPEAELYGPDGQQVPLW